MPKNEVQKVRIVCPVAGYEEFWIEYDVSEWGIGTYLRLHSDEMSIAQVLREFIPRYSIDWQIINADGAAIKHPGPGRTEILWQEIWDSFGVELRELFSWFWMSAISAMSQAMTLSKKRPAPDSGAGAGEDGAAGRDEGEPAA
jgi:hypothetical protein